MNIRFVSTITPEDEDRFAPVLLGALAQILEHLPLPYAIRIETAAGRVFERSRPAFELTRSQPAQAPVDSAAKYVSPSTRP
jgi:hypothetical protein